MVSATDPDSDSLTLRIEAVDGFLFPGADTFNTQTGQFNWTAPTDVSGETFAARFVVTDRFGNFDSEIIELLVSAVEINGAPQTVAEGTQIDLSSSVVVVSGGITPT